MATRSVRSVAAAGAVPAPRRAQHPLLRGDVRFGYALLLPAGILIAVLVGFPFLRALWLSFHDKLLGKQEAPWIGLQNYTSLLQDNTFWQAVKNTFIFTVGSVACKLLIGLVVALILNEALPLRALWRAIVLLPYAMPTLVSVLVWKWMYNDVSGVLNYLLTETKITDHPILWLSDPGRAMPAVIAVNVWRGFPFFVITILAGLQAVPQELYDAAKVDGAGIWSRFWKVTLPSILPVMAVTTLFSTILTFNDFSIIWILTQGGPGNATNVLSTLTYNIAIRGYQLGKGVAISVLMLPILVALILLLNRFINRRETGMTVKTMAARSASQAMIDRRIRVHRTQQIAVRVVGWILLAVVLIAALFPVYFMTITAFHPPSLSFNRKPTIFSADLSLKAFRDLIHKYPYMTWFRNTTIISMSSTILSVFVATLAAYSLSRLRYPGRRALSSAVFFVYLFPSTLLFIPIFIVLNSVHLLDSLPALIAVYLTFSIPFCIWLLKAYFLGIPRDLEDAAQVDGATRWQSMTRVVLPLATPGIAVACIYCFTLAWNEYLYAFILLSSQEKFTLAPGLTKLITGDVFLWGMIMAGGVLMSAPLLILYFLAQRFIVAGLSAGAVKG